MFQKRKWRTLTDFFISNIAFLSEMHLFSILHRNGDGQKSSRHKNQPLLRTRWMCWFWCEADAYYKRGRWQIHFQPSWRCKGTSREPKTTFPLKIFMIAVWEYSTAFFVREKRVFNSIEKKQSRRCCHWGLVLA